MEMWLFIGFYSLPCIQCADGSIDSDRRHMHVAEPVAFVPASECCVQMEKRWMQQPHGQPALFQHPFVEEDHLQQQQAIANGLRQRHLGLRRR